MTWNTISHLLLWTVVIIQFSLLFILTRLLVQFLTRFRIAGQKVEEISLRTHTSAPLFRAKDHHGQLIKLHDYMGEEILLIFSSTTCPTCESLLERLTKLSVTKIVISSEKYNGDTIKKYPQYVFLQSTDIIENYYIQKVPTMVLINKEGEIQYIGDKDQVVQIEQQLNSLNLVHVQTG